MKKIKNTARILIFVVLLACLLSGLNRLLMLKDSEVLIKPFLDRAEEYDVLFLGDSSVMNGIMPMELYQKYGITAYCLASGNSRLPMTYWKLMYALDHMTPKLVMLSAADGNAPELTDPESEWLHVAFDGFPMTLTKIRAILELTDQEGTDKSGTSYSDIRKEMFFPLMKYHSRWSSLTEEDLHPVYNMMKGFVPLTHVSDPDVEAKLADPDDCAPEQGYDFAYMRKIIELCQERGIPVVVYQAPYPIREFSHRGIHTSAKIAAEYGVPMLDFPAMDRVVDYYVDCADPGGHLNVSGSAKLTDFLGDYMSRHYDLPDRREDPAYAEWKNDWNVYVDEKIRMIAEDADSLRSRLMMLHDESFNIVLTVRAGFDYKHRNTMIALQNIAREHVYETDDLVSGKIDPLEGLSDAEDYNEGYMIIVDRDAGDEYEAIQEYYGIGEQEFETSFGYVFCRMDGEWIDTSITQGDTETYYFDNWDDQEQDIRLILIDRRTGKPALTMAFSRTEEEKL